MTTPQRRADAQSRLRKAHVTLVAARALLEHQPPLLDDAVNRASTAALQAARALVDSQWARESQPGFDPNWRPGMPAPGQPRDPLSLAAVRKLLDRFHDLANGLHLAPDFTDYVRTLVEDGLDADWGELEYDEGEAREAIDIASKLIFTVADQIGLANEFAPPLAEELDPHDLPTSEHPMTPLFQDEITGASAGVPKAVESAGPPAPLNANTTAPAGSDVIASGPT